VGWEGQLAAATAVMLAATVQSSTGFGFGMLAAPVLAVVDTALVPGPLLVLSLFISGMTALREIRSIDLRGLSLATVGRIAGSLAAAATMAALPGRWFAIIFAVLVLIGCACSAGGWRFHPSRRGLVLAGTASGYMGTITSIGSPPMALVYQSQPGPQIRSTMAAFFVLGGIASLASLAWFGQVTAATMTTGLWLLPPLLLGFGVSRWLIGHVDKGLMRPIILSISALSAVLLLVRSLV
jgi:uncharacterized protein